MRRGRERDIIIFHLFLESRPSFSLVFKQPSFFFTCYKQRTFLSPKIFFPVIPFHFSSQGAQTLTHDTRNKTALNMRVKAVAGLEKANVALIREDLHSDRDKRAYVAYWILESANSSNSPHIPKPTHPTMTKAVQDTCDI